MMPPTVQMQHVMKAVRTAEGMALGTLILVPVGTDLNKLYIPCDGRIASGEDYPDLYEMMPSEMRRPNLYIIGLDGIIRRKVFITYDMRGKTNG